MRKRTKRPLKWQEHTVQRERATDEAWRDACRTLAEFLHEPVLAQRLMALFKSGVIARAPGQDQLAAEREGRRDAA